MKRRTCINKTEHLRTTFNQGHSSFIKSCQIRNLSKQTISYYEENNSYFQKKTGVKYLDEISTDFVNDFLLKEIEEGKKVTSLNTRLRGLRVFLKFCAEREYVEPIDIKLMKQDEEIKEPYTEAELKKLLKTPASDRWTEWRTWAAINYMIGTGNRVSTVINVKIADVNFEEMTIHLRTVKNRHQQIVPLSPALKKILQLYLSKWEWKDTDYLFPSSMTDEAMNLRTFQGSVSRYNISRGVTKTSCHLFRHTFAKNFILAGGGMVQLQALLGHSTLEMTRHYVNLYGVDLKKNYEKLNPLDNLYGF